MIRKIGLKTAGIVSVIVSGITIIINLLVMLQIMPFTWINGGRTASFAVAVQNSWVSIAILLVIIFITLWAGGMIPISKFKTFLKIILWVLFGYACLSILMQLLGTTFEKSVTSVLCIVNSVATFRLAVEKR